MLKRNNKKILISAKKEFNNEINLYKLMLTRMITNSTDTIVVKTTQHLYKLSNNYIANINAIKNIEQLKIEIIKFKNDINLILSNFILEYCEKYEIKVENDKLEKYWLNKLYDQLEEIKNKDNIIEALLNEREQRYITYPEYDIIKKHIPEIKKHVIKMYYENYTNKETILMHFDFRIAVLRRKYLERQEIIDYYKSLCLQDQFVINQIKLMEENIDGSMMIFKKIETELKKYIECKSINNRKEKEPNILKRKKQK